MARVEARAAEKAARTKERRARQDEVPLSEVLEVLIREVASEFHSTDAEACAKESAAIGNLTKAWARARASETGRDKEGRPCVVDANQGTIRQRRRRYKMQKKASGAERTQPRAGEGGSAAAAPGAPPQEGS
jgi:hypothetical protein